MKISSSRKNLKKYLQNKSSKKKYNYSYFKKWRPFCESYRDQVEEYNMGTLLRISSESDYCEENTTLGLFIIE